MTDWTRPCPHGRNLDAVIDRPADHPVPFCSWCGKEFPSDIPAATLAEERAADTLDRRRSRRGWWPLLAALVLLALSAAAVIADFC